MAQAAALHGALDAFGDLVVDKLVARLRAEGLVVQQASLANAPVAGADSSYDASTCASFLDPAHLGDGVLDRAAVFFGELDRNGEITSTELVSVLGLKNARRVSASLTNSLKQNAARLGISVPWTQATEAGRTVWRDRDGVAGRMVTATGAERARRGLTH